MRFTLDQVKQINRDVINAVDGQGGLIAAIDEGKLESALGRIDNLELYGSLENIYEIAAWYAVAIAKSHAFTDGNKRTGFVVALTYLQQQGIEVQAVDVLEQVMVDVAQSELDATELAKVFFYLTANLEALAENIDTDPVLNAQRRDFIEGWSLLSDPDLRIGKLDADN